MEDCTIGTFYELKWNAGCADWTAHLMYGNNVERNISMTGGRIHTTQTCFEKCKATSGCVEFFMSTEPGYAGACSLYSSPCNKKVYNPKVH